MRMPSGGLCHFFGYFYCKFKDMVMVVHDISPDLMKARLYPGTVPPAVSVVSEIGEVSPYRVSAICADLHTGSHVDSPRHCFPDGMGIAELPLDCFLGKCLVVERNGDGLVLPAATDDVRIVLFKNCRRFHLCEAECRAIVEAGFVSVGCDDISVGTGSEEYPVHRVLLGAGIPVIEGLCLDGILPGIYFLSALPVKIGGVEAAFCRAALMEL